MPAPRQDHFVTQAIDCGSHICEGEQLRSPAEPSLLSVSLETPPAELPLAELPLPAAEPPDPPLSLLLAPEPPLPPEPLLL